MKATLADGTVIEYTYDGIGRRVARTVNGQTWQYLYGNPGNPVQITATREPDGTLTGYYYDGDGRLFSFARNGVRYYAACDQVGTPKVVTDTAGNTVKQLSYDSFGCLTNDSNPTFFLPVGFAGGLADPDTGLIRLGFRDYDPAAGRWTAKDPIFFNGGQFNLYGYCGSDPIDYVDPAGLAYDFMDAIADVSAGIGGFARRVDIAGYIKNNMIKYFPKPIPHTYNPFKSVGKLSPWATGLKAGWDVAETWDKACKSTGKKIAKTAIILGGAALSYGAGATVAGFTAASGPGAYTAGVGVTMLMSAGVSWAQDQAYNYFDL